MKKVNYLLLPIYMGMILHLSSCTKDSEPAPLSVVSVITDLGVNLTNSGIATDVPLNTMLIVTFDREIDAASATATSLALKGNDGNILSEIVVNGAVVSIKTIKDLETGTPYTLIITPELTAINGAPATATEFTFKSFGHEIVKPPQSTQLLSYFPFSGSMTDAFGQHSPAEADIRNLTYATDRFGYDHSAGEFDGTTTIVEIPEGNQYMANRSMTVSVWIMASSTKDGQFIMGLGAWMGFHSEISSDWSTIKVVTQFAEEGGISDSEDVSFSGTGLTKENGGWPGCTFNKEMPLGSVGETYLKDKWAHVVYTYDEFSQLNTLFINGEKVVENDFGLWPTTDLKSTITGVKFAGNLDNGGNKLALGFIQGSQNRIITGSWANPDDVYSYHFKGLMDDLRIFKVALTVAEVATLYNNEKPL